jgi:hypothetical protein
MKTADRDFEVLKMGRREKPWAGGNETHPKRRCTGPGG